MNASRCTANGLTAAAATTASTRSASPWKTTILSAAGEPSMKTAATSMPPACRFTHAFAEHLLAFALARQLTAADQPAIRRIARRTAKDGYRMQTLLREIVSSTPFRAPAGAPASSTASHKEHLP